MADLNVHEGVSHADYLLVPDSPASQQVYAELNAFLLRRLELGERAPRAPRQAG